jgi:hypothetical protein
LTVVEEKFLKIDHDLSQLKAYVAKLGVRVEDAEAAVEQVRTLGATVPVRDSLTEQVYEWLQAVPGLKVSAHIVANNLEDGAEKAGQIRGRLESLANSGRISKHKAEGKTTMFWYDAPKTNES